MNRNTLIVCEFLVDLIFESNQHIVEFVDSCVQKGQNEFVEECRLFLYSECYYIAKKQLKPSKILKELIAEKIELLINEKFTNFEIKMEPNEE